MRLRRSCKGNPLDVASEERALPDQYGLQASILQTIGRLGLLSVVQRLWPAPLQPAPRLCQTPFWQLILRWFLICIQVTDEFAADQAHQLFYSGLHTLTARITGVIVLGRAARRPGTLLVQARPAPFCPDPAAFLETLALFHSHPPRCCASWKSSDLYSSIIDHWHIYRQGWSARPLGRRNGFDNHWARPRHQ